MLPWAELSGMSLADEASQSRRLMRQQLARGRSYSSSDASEILIRVGTVERQRGIELLVVKNGNQRLLYCDQHVEISPHVRIPRGVLRGWPESRPAALKGTQPAQTRYGRDLTSEPSRRVAEKPLDQTPLAHKLSTRSVQSCDVHAVRNRLIACGRSARNQQEHDPNDNQLARPHTRSVDRVGRAEWCPRSLVDARRRGTRIEILAWASVGECHESASRSTLN